MEFQMKVSKKLRLALIIFGFLLVIQPVVSTALPHSTLLVDTSPPTFVGFWGGNSASTPIQIAPGTTSVTIWIKCYDVDQDYNVANIASATVQLYQGTSPLSSVFSLSYVPSQSSPPDYYYWNVASVPILSSYPQSTLLKAVYIINDAAGNTNTINGYFTIGGITADFYLNNIKVASTDTVRLNTRVLSFKVVPTAGASLIAKSDVDIFVGLQSPQYLTTVHLALQTDGTYIGTYTLGSDGTYVLIATVTTYGNIPILLSSITLNMGSSIPLSLIQQLLGGLLMLAGVLMQRDKKRK